MASVNKELTQSRLKELLNYDENSGKFSWVQSKGNRKECAKAGSMHNQGYTVIRVDGKTYKAHRLAWLYMTSEFPVNQIDHKNGIKNDNQWANLRVCSQSENQKNSAIRADNTSGYKGVSWSINLQKWIAYAYLNKVRKHLGYFTLAEDASTARENFAKKHHGDFYRATV